MDQRSQRDEWIWRRVYAAAVWGVRLLALPCALSATLLLADAYVLPNDPPEPYRPSRLVCHTPASRLLSRRVGPPCTLVLRRLAPDGYFRVEGEDIPLWLEPVEVAVSRSFGRRIESSDTIHVSRTPLYGEVSGLRIGSGGGSDVSDQNTWLTLFAFAGALPLLYWRRGATHWPEAIDLTDDPDDFSAPLRPVTETVVLLLAAVGIEVAMLVPLWRLFAA